MSPRPPRPPEPSPPAPPPDGPPVPPAPEGVPAPATPSAPDGVGIPAGTLRRTRVFLEMVKFSHTIFALPFALAGLLMARRGLPDLHTAGWVLAAMVGARTAAMAFNRLADHRYDALNPRTAGRALPAGILSRRTVLLGFLLAAGVFGVSAWALNPLCFLLAAPTLVVLLGYSAAKRFTSLSHFILGLALGLAPVGAYLGVTGEFDGGFLAPALLGGAVLTWVAGFDIIYASQDVEPDRLAGLHSLPLRLGVGPALRVSRWLHAVTVVLLLLFGVEAGLGAFFLGVVAIVAVLLVVEHRLVAPDDLRRVNVAFFHVNAAISLLVLAGVVADLLVPGAIARWRDWVATPDKGPDSLVIIGVMLLAGHLLGEAAHLVRVPRITGYLAAGVLLGHSGLGLLMDPEIAGRLPEFLEPGETMARIALGLIVFTVGLQVDLWDLVKNPRPALLGVAESALCGVLVTAGLVWVAGWELRLAAALGAIAMSSSPAVVILVRRELGADGPMVRRVLATVGLNNLLSFVAFTFAFPPMAAAVGMYEEQAWGVAMYRLVGSLGVGVLLGAALGWLEAALARDLGIFLLRGGTVLLGIGVSENLALSPLLLLLVTGMSAEAFARWKKRELDVNFGRVEVAFFIVLFVVSGTHIDFHLLLEVGVAGVVVVLGRVVGKVAGVYLAGGVAGVPELKQRGAISLCLVPMAGMALGLTQILRDSFPGDERVGAAAALVLAAVAVFETVGPPLTRLGLILTGEVPEGADVSH